MKITIALFLLISSMYQTEKNNKTVGDKMKVIVDRIEGEMLVVELENMSTVNIPHAVIPEAKEGDVINITVDSGDTEIRRRRIREKMNKLWEN